jgi:hypothetical protein
MFAKIAASFCLFVQKIGKFLCSGSCVCEKDGEIGSVAKEESPDVDIPKGPVLYPISHMDGRTYPRLAYNHVAGEMRTNYFIKTHKDGVIEFVYLDHFLEKHMDLGMN